MRKRSRGSTSSFRDTPGVGSVVYRRSALVPLLKRYGWSGLPGCFVSMLKAAWSRIRFSRAEATVSLHRSVKPRTAGELRRKTSPVLKSQCSSGERASLGRSMQSVATARSAWAHAPS